MAVSAPSATKQCTNCGQEKPLECFTKDARYRSGRVSWCKDCVGRKARQVKQRQTAERKAAERRQAVEIDAAKLRNFREQHGLTVQQLALRSGVPCQHLERAEETGRIRGECLEGLLSATSAIVARERERTERLMERIEKAGL